VNTVVQQVDQVLNRLEANPGIPLQERVAAEKEDRPYRFRGDALPHSNRVGENDLPL
jgi:hypothetical protein